MWAKMEISLLRPQSNTGNVLPKASIHTQINKFKKKKKGNVELRTK